VQAKNTLYRIEAAYEINTVISHIPKIGNWRNNIINAKQTEGKDKRIKQWSWKEILNGQCCKNKRKRMLILKQVRIVNKRKFII